MNFKNKNMYWMQEIRKTMQSSWSAGFANRENILIFGGLKIHKDFFATSKGFWL
jgi:hypothetical protein